MIQCENIKIQFGDKQVLKDVSLELKDGQITSLIGNNGAGKSTLIGILSGYYLDYQGKTNKPKVSIMPDAKSTYENMTGKEFLQYMSLVKTGKDDAETYTSLYKRLNLEKQINSKIKGYSFGMRKKISFIQCCVGNFQNYIFDEPTSGVDEPSAIVMMDIIKEIKNNGKSILLTSHNLDELERVSDYIYIIDQGKIINEGSPNEIVTKDNKNSHNYFINGKNVKDAKTLLESLYSVKIKIINPNAISLQLSSENISLIISTLLKEGYQLDEFYKEKKSLRESVYH